MGTTLRYKGGMDEVEVPAAGMVVQRLEWVEMDTEVARGLLEQEDNWERPAPKKRRSTPTTASEPPESSQDPEGNGSDDEAEQGGDE